MRPFLALAASRVRVTAQDAGLRGGIPMLGSQTCFSIAFSRGERDWPSVASSRNPSHQPAATSRERPSPTSRLARRPPPRQLGTSAEQPCHRPSDRVTGLWTPRMPAGTNEPPTNLGSGIEIGTVVLTLSWASLPTSEHVRSSLNGIILLHLPCTPCLAASRDGNRPIRKVDPAPLPSLPPCLFLPSTRGEPSRSRALF